MVFNNNLLLGAAGQGGGYEIDQSIRFDKTTSSHLSNTYGSAGNRRTWTFSTWFKRGKIDGTRQILFAATGQAYLQVGPDAASREMITILNEGSGTDLNWYTTQVFRDPSAWYHLVWQFDSTQADADNRTKLYINGAQVTAFTKAATPAQNFEGAINNAVEHKIGEGHTAANYFDGYQAEINFIDGTALDPTSFGETNDDGVWVPIAYTGSYGSNGFYITGETAGDLGEDFSGNGNDFTSSGLATTDQMLDTPTDNFCVLSPVDKNSNFTLSDGNLTNSNGTNAHAACFSTISFDASDTDGWYWEVDCDSFQSTGFAVLIADEAVNQTDITTDPTTQPAEGNLWSHRRYINDSNGATTGVGATGSWTNYGPAAVNGDVIGYCVKNGKLFIAINNTWLESSDPDTEASPAFSNLTGNLRVGVNRFGDTGTDVTTLNFGQTGFTYTPPTGAKAITTANLATPSITDGSAYFDTSLWTGNDTDGRAITGYNFQPDWVWIKSRSGAYSHSLTDAVRGAGIYLQSNTSDPEVTGPGAFGSTLAFTSDGYTLDNGTSDNLYVNAGGETYVGWAWAANGSGSSNTDGSITSTASANTTAGFSIVTYSGASGTQTVGHGLGLVPKMMLAKRLNSANDWSVYHASPPVTNILLLNTTGASYNPADADWQDTAPTSSVFYVGNEAGRTNRSGDNFVCYCFAEIPGYSSFGSYTGNGSADGPFVYTGFEPAFVLIKRTNATENWLMMDSTRYPNNPANNPIFANTSNADANGGRPTDFLSNGFKPRNTLAGMNASGSTYIYMAFAEHPFGGDSVAPVTAR